jgi:hypothetical protein
VAIPRWWHPSDPSGCSTVPYGLPFKTGCATAAPNRPLDTKAVAGSKRRRWARETCCAPVWAWKRYTAYVNRRFVAFLIMLSIGLRKEENCAGPAHPRGGAGLLASFERIDTPRGEFP